METNIQKMKSANNEDEVIVFKSPWESPTEQPGFENEIRLVRAAIDTMVRSGKVTPQTWDMALKSLTMLEKLEREERQERLRRENSELNRLKHELAMKKENSINIDEYRESLRQVQNLIEEYVPRDRFRDFVSRFQQIFSSVEKD